MKNLETIAELYHKFSLLFSQPESETWKNEQFLDSFCKQINELELSENCESSSFRLLSNSFTNEDLLLNYSRLFLGPFKVLVPPYGSCHIDESKQLNQESTVEVQKFYLEFGIDISESFHDLPDHIVPELEFMHYLVYSQINPTENLDKKPEEIFEAQKKFFNKYFYPFAKSFCDTILSETNSSIYQSLAKLFVAFLISEKERFELIL